MLVTDDEQEEEPVGKEKGGFWVGLAATVFHPATVLLGKRVYEGLENVPQQGPALLVFNHISHIDPMYDAVYVHKAGRVPRFLAKSSLWKVPVFGRVLVGSGQIPVYRDTTDAQQSLRAAHEALRSDKIVVIYPEGTITKDPDGWPMVSRTGVARLALENDIPVIPVARWGTNELYNGYTGKFRPFPRKRIVVRSGKPIDLSEYRERHRDAALLREVTDLIMTEVRSMVGELRGEVPPAAFYVKSGQDK